MNISEWRKANPSTIFCEDGIGRTKQVPRIGRELPYIKAHAEKFFESYKYILHTQDGTEYGVSMSRQTLMRCAMECEDLEVSTIRQYKKRYDL